jgi:hypothetical protein
VADSLRDDLWKEARSNARYLIVFVGWAIGHHVLNGKDSLLVDVGLFVGSALVVSAAFLVWNMRPVFELQWKLPGKGSVLKGPIAELPLRSTGDANVEVNLDYKEAGALARRVGQSSVGKRCPALVISLKPPGGLVLGFNGAKDPQGVTVRDNTLRVSPNALHGESYLGWVGIGLSPDERLLSRTWKVVPEVSVPDRALLGRMLVRTQSNLKGIRFVSLGEG